MAGEDSENEEVKALDIPYQRTINGINPWKRAIVTIAGVAFNFAFALLLLGIYIFCNGVSTNDNTIDVVDNSIAYSSGLSDGDKIIAVKDIKIFSNDEIIYSDCTSSRCDIRDFKGFNEYINNDNLKNETKDYYQEHKDDANFTKITQEITIIYTHEGTDSELTTSLVRDYNTSESSFPLLGLNEATKIPGFFQGLAMTFQTFGKIIVLMFQAIANLFTPEGFNSLGGVVSMYQSSASMAQEGILAYIWYLAIISVNLGFFNLLPIPALDGARFYISIFEGITSKKINPKVEGYMNLCGIILLFSLMIVVTIKDIVGLF